MEGSAPPAAPAAPAPPVPAVAQSYRFEFDAHGGEYFRIWIVNLLLTIVTLGIYSAWAKVRKLQYLYGHTRLAGSAFGYHGEPLKILRGRLIAAALGARARQLGGFVWTESAFVTGAGCSAPCVGTACVPAPHVHWVATPIVHGGYRR